MALLDALLVPETVALFCTGTFISYWFFWIIYSRFFHPLRNIPGPFAASISRGWLVYATLRGDIDKVQRALHEKYGPLIRIAPNYIACADPEAIKLIYSTQQPLTKGDFYPVWGSKAFTKWPDNFSVLDEKLHAQRRRIVNPIYTLSSVLKCEPYIDKCIRIFMQKIGAVADRNEVLDLGEWFQWYTFDVIGQLYFGDMFGFLQNTHDHGSWIKSLDTLMPVFLTVAVSPPWSRPFILMSSMFSAGIRRGLKAFNHIEQAARDCVLKRTSREQQEADSDRDLLGQLLEIVREKGDKVHYGIPEVQLEAWVAIFAGSDSTAIALRAVIYYLLKDPESYETLQKEIDKADRAGKLSDVVQYAEAMELPFFCACVKEAMRLHPSVGLTMGRLAPAAGLTVAQTYIPPGYEVGMNAAVIHYNRDVFGEDAHVFRPSRWLTSNTTEMEKSVLTFGAGTRTCTGRNISLSEVHKAIPQILRLFDLKLTHNNPWKTMDYWFHKQTGITVHVKRRTQATKVN